MIELSALSIIELLICGKADLCRKWSINFNKGKIQVALFHCLINSGTVMIKMDLSVLDVSAMDVFAF